MNFLKEMLSYESNTSSARVINIIGAVVASVLLIVDTAINSALRTDALYAYLAYCAGVYGTSKYLDRKAIDV